MQTQTTPATTAIVADPIGERARIVGAAVAYLSDQGGIGWATHARLLKGITLMQRGHVTETAECGTYRVRSASDPQTAYLVRSDLHCSCPDHQNRQVRCCHMAAVMLAGIVERELGHRALNRAAAAPYFGQTRQPCKSQAVGVAA